VTVSRAANGVTLTGKGDYTIAQALAVKLNSRLPEITIKLGGDPLAAGRTLTMKYTLTRSDGVVSNKQTALPKPAADGLIHLFLPVEEPVNSPYKHTLKIELISGDEYRVLPPVGGSFPTPEVYRGMPTYAFPDLTNIAVAAKYRVHSLRR
jgi:hypothetical protein